jgi:uncharacterized UPF0160 family protein
MNKIITHDGCFHTDEVVACMLLTIYFDGDVEIIRTRDENVIENTNAVIVDVGKRYDGIKRFDHHQYPDEKGYIARWDETISKVFSIPLSSAGMIWKHFGVSICKKLFSDCSDHDIEQIYKKMYGNFFIEIDANDNGIDQYMDKARRKKYNINATLVGTIGRLNHENPYDSDMQMKMFKEAMIFSERMFRIHLNTYKNNQITLESDTATMKQYYTERLDPRILIIENDIKNWRGILREIDKEEKILFIVYPRETQWGVKAIPKLGFVPRKNIASEEILKQTVGDNLIFLHKKRFMCSCKTKQSAIDCAKASLE